MHHRGVPRAVGVLLALAWGCRSGTPANVGPDATYESGGYFAGDIPPDWDASADAVGEATADVLYAGGDSTDASGDAVTDAFDAGETQDAADGLAPDGL